MEHDGRELPHQPHQGEPVLRFARLSARTRAGQVRYIHRAISVDTWTRSGIGLLILNDDQSLVVWVDRKSRAILKEYVLPDYITNATGYVKGSPEEQMLRDKMKGEQQVRVAVSVRVLRPRPGVRSPFNI